MHRRIAYFLVCFSVGFGSCSAAFAEDGRAIVLEAMSSRPNAPWPRGEGHVVLGEPGSPESAKAYHEPGGSFSPGFASFGVSFWVLNQRGIPVLSSDTLPMNQITQRWVQISRPMWPKVLDVPSVRTDTAYYRTEWSFDGLGKWKLHFRGKGDQRKAMVFRSVGPSGGRIYTFNWQDPQELLINNRWRVKFSHTPMEVEVVPPPRSRLTQPVVGEVSWHEEEEWGYAKFTWMPAMECWMTIEDKIGVYVNSLEVSSLRPGVKVKVPDDTFMGCLDAQVANLMMGLVGGETRPGDPNHYPLNWLRDGAYVISALARAGQVDVAVQLCGAFGEYDFFGGFGSEADAPGLALWALEQTASRARDKDFDEWCWPHVRRKAELIEQMRTAKEPLRLPYVGPVVPAYSEEENLDLVCDPAKDGLIQGRMDWHRPIFYVNAVSYQGLKSAAALGERLGHQSQASSWRGSAADIKHALAKASVKDLEDNDRTFICGLYPTWVVADRGQYGKALADRWETVHDEAGNWNRENLWTYFPLAEAHQWLSYRAPEKPWGEFQWYVQHQASPGLFTWWEGQDEENSFGLWEGARGWVDPPHVTPHYWTAAEMLLLQLDMLTMLDESTATPTILIGAGVPKHWLEESMSVEGMQTRLGRVDWKWARGKMTVRLRGFEAPVKLGTNFDADTPLKVKN